MEGGRNHIREAMFQKQTRMNQNAKAVIIQNLTSIGYVVMYAEAGGTVSVPGFEYLMLQ